MERRKETASNRELEMLMWEELHHFVSRDIVVEVEHVKAQPTKMDQDRFVTI